MNCPKCDHPQADDVVQCEACGVVIAKYREMQLEAHQSALYGELGEGEGHAGLTGRTITAIAAGLALVAIVVWRLFAADDDLPTRTAAPVSASVATIDSPTLDGAAEEATDTATAALETTVSDVVTRARDATVSIETSWSTGSGFFVTDDCAVLTNRHVVEPDEGAVDALDAELGSAEEMLDRMAAAIEARREAFLGQCSDCSDEAYQAVVGGLEDQHAESSERVDAARFELDAARFGDELVVVTSEGARYEAELERSHDEWDLALLSIASGACVFLEAGDEDRLKPGAPLYAVGSPLGLGHSVTSGIFSGFRDVDEFRLIQTDAPINPGNSGGPLVDAAGGVVGINTLKVQDADGIGFAIPFSTASRVLDFD